MKRVGVLSDTHLIRVTRELQDICGRFFSDVDLILHAGDVVCEEVVRFLSQIPFHGVHGNVDPVEVRRLLPSHKIIEINKKRVGLTHGRGAPEGIEERILEDFEEVDLIVYGHLHRPVDHVNHGVRFFNPGTATGQARHGLRTIGLLEFDGGITGRIENV